MKIVDENILKRLSKNNKHEFSVQINQNKHMHKAHRNIGALSPIAQLVVAKLVCRIVDWRADIFMSEKLDIYQI